MNTEQKEGLNWSLASGYKIQTDNYADCINNSNWQSPFDAEP